MSALKAVSLAIFLASSLTMPGFSQFEGDVINIPLILTPEEEFTLAMKRWLRGRDIPIVNPPEELIGVWNLSAQIWRIRSKHERSGDFPTEREEGSTLISQHWGCLRFVPARHPGNLTDQNRYVQVGVGSNLVPNRDLGRNEFFSNLTGTRYDCGEHLSFATNFVPNSIDDAWRNLFIFSVPGDEMRFGCRFLSESQERIGCLVNYRNGTHGIVEYVREQPGEKAARRGRSSNFLRVHPDWQPE